MKSSLNSGNNKRIFETVAMRREAEIQVSGITETCNHSFSEKVDNK
jgi:hypothetical protein